MHPPGYIMTGQNALLDIDGKVSLGTSIQVAYERQLNALPEFSSSDLYYVTGPASGTVTVGAMVSKAGFFKNLGLNSGNCGTIEKIVLSLGGTNGCAQVTSSSAIHVKNAVLARVGVTVEAGPRPINQNVVFLISFLSVT